MSTTEFEDLKKLLLVMSSELNWVSQWLGEIEESSHQKDLLDGQHSLPMESD